MVWGRGDAAANIGGGSAVAASFAAEKKGADPRY